MQKYKVTLAYDGTDFEGFQIQPRGRTIQGEVEKALKKIAKNHFVRIHPSGRTDSGVHARGQVFHFTWPLAKALPAATIKKALNVNLPRDVQVLAVEAVTQDFHARYHAQTKTYRYLVQAPSFNDPLTYRYIYHHPYALDLKKLTQALDQLQGTHDFTGFSSAKSDKTDKIRTLYEAQVTYNEDKSLYTFTFTGDGFLYNMVRRMMGALLLIGDGRQPIAIIDKIFHLSEENTLAPTAAACGLYLESVEYEKNFRS